MKMKKASVILIVAVMIVFSTLSFSLFISENASAHAPAALYPTYKEGTLTVYIDHPSDDPNTHYIKTVTVIVNDVEVLNKTYTSQQLDDAKGMVTYSYTVKASDGDVISVTAECSIDGSITETHTVGEYDKNGDKEYPDKDYPDKNGDTDQKGDADQDNENLLLLSGAIVGVLIVIVVLVAMLIPKKKGTAKKGTTTSGKTKKDTIKKDEWTICPKCGSSIRMGQFPSHLDTVHPKLTKKTKEKMIDQVMKRV